METNEIVDITYQKTELKPSLGETRVLVHYQMRHVKYGRENTYNVVCQLHGLRDVDPHLFVNEWDVTWVGNMETESNDETLTPAGAMELFESKAGL